MKNPNETNPTTANGWNEWSKHVLLEIVRLNKCIEDISTNIDSLKLEHVKAIEILRKETTAAIESLKLETVKELAAIKTEIALLKLKAAGWGAVGSAVPILLTLVIALLVHFLTK